MFLDRMQTLIATIAHVQNACMSFAGGLHKYNFVFLGQERPICHINLLV